MNWTRTRRFSISLLLLVAGACMFENTAALLSPSRMVSSAPGAVKHVTAAVVRFDKGKRLGRNLQDSKTEELELDGVSMDLEGVTDLQGNWYDTWVNVTVGQIGEEIESELSGTGEFEYDVELYFPIPSSTTGDTLTMEFRVEAIITSFVENHNLAEYVEEAFDSEDDKETYLEALRDTGDPTFEDVSSVSVSVPDVTPPTTSEPPTTTTTDSPTPTTATEPPTSTTTTTTDPPTTTATTTEDPPTTTTRTTDPPTTTTTDPPTTSTTSTPTTTTTPRPTLPTTDPPSVSPTEPATVSPPTPEITTESPPPVPTTQAPPVGATAVPPTTNEPTTTETPAPTEDGTSGRGSGETQGSTSDTTGLIVGVILAGAVCISMVAFLIGRSQYCRSSNGSSTYPSDEHQPQEQASKEIVSVIQVPFGGREDEISTLGDPLSMAATRGVGSDSASPSVSTLGYDFERAYVRGVNEPRSPNPETVSTVSPTSSSLQYSMSESDNVTPSTGDSLAYSHDKDEGDSEPANASAPHAVYAMPPAYLEREAPRHQEDVANEPQRKVSWSSSVNTGSVSALYVDQESLDAVYNADD